MSGDPDRFQSLFLGLLDGAAVHELICDAQGTPVDYRFLDVNPAFEILTGLPRDQVVGNTVLEVMPGTERIWIERYGAVVQTGQPASFEHDARELGGRVFLVSAFALGGALFAVVFRDVTEARNAEEALERRVAARTAALATANAELEAFSYAVSHDLRAPLRAIDGFSLAAIEDAGATLNAEARSHLVRVRAAAGRMATMIDALLGLSRVVRQEMAPVTIDLSALATELGAELAVMHPDRRVVFTVAPGLSCAGDPALLRIALTNLLGNAWKYTQGRDPAHVAVDTVTEDGRRWFRVRDDGVGFDPAYAQRLFTAFQRLHAATDFAGHGIGLATVARIVRRHGGQVRALGQPGAGAAFLFHLPDVLA